MSSVIIFYEILSREYPACDKIRKILEEKHNHKVGVFSIIYEYYKAIKFAKKNGVDCVVMPWLREEENYAAMKHFVEINNKVILCNFSHEQIASDETCELYIPKTEEIKNKVFHFCWGEHFKDLIVRNGVNSKNAVVTGNSRLDFKYECKMNREILAKEFNLDLNKKWILFAESRDWVLDGCNLETRIQQGLDEALEKESYEWSKKYLEEIYAQLNELDEKFFEKFEFIYRPHPSCSNPKGITNPNVKVTANYSIYEWLKNCDYYISSASTSAFEAESMGKPVVCFEIKDMPKTFKTYGLENYIQINHLSSIDDKLFEKALKVTNGQNIFAKYVGVCDGKNCERTADIIDELLNSNIDFVHKKVKDCANNNNMPTKFRSLVKNMLMGMGLVRLVKSKEWCSLAYKDCPFTRTNKKMYGIKNETRK